MRHRTEDDALPTATSICPNNGSGALRQRGGLEASQWTIGLHPLIEGK
jgi:hypothetical protein